MQGVRRREQTKALSLHEVIAECFNGIAMSAGRVPSARAHALDMVARREHARRAIQIAAESFGLAQCCCAGPRARASGVHRGPWLPLLRLIPLHRPPNERWNCQRMAIEGLRLTPQALIGILCNSTLGVRRREHTKALSLHEIIAECLMWSRRLLVASRWP